MTKSTQFFPFLLSILFSVRCGAILPILGTRIMFDIFYVHERGRAGSSISFSF